jgi:TRAP-type mannitol/chloroaromatic compound transport system substrate-binding protein
LIEEGSMSKRNPKLNPQARPAASRRKFLGAATAATTGAAMLGFPMIAKAQAAQVRWKLQSANPAGTPHMTLLNRFATNVDSMSGGRLKIEVLPSGAIVAPFEILDGVNKGIVDAGQWWTHYATGKHPAGGLFSAPIGGAGSGLDQMNHLSWYLRGGGRELYLEYYQKILKADVQAFLYAPDGPEAFGWVKRVPKTVAEYTKMRFRMSSGLPSDVLKDMGGVPMNLAGAEVIPAAERGLIDGVEWINPANDLKLGLSDVFKNYSLQGLHQAIDIADVVISGRKWRELTPDLQAIVQTAMTTSIFEAILYFVDENSKALRTLTREKGVKMFDAPPDYAPAFIKSAKKVLAQYEAKDPFFKRVLESQRRFAAVVVPYTKETNKLTQLIAGAAEAP